MRMKDYPLRNVFVFGAPRIGSRDFEAKFHHAMKPRDASDPGVTQVRIMNSCSNKKDLVPRMPSMLFGTLISDEVVF
jgi:hypothetical protein